jgi:hypothetical protein
MGAHLPANIQFYGRRLKTWPRHVHWDLPDPAELMLLAGEIEESVHSACESCIRGWMTGICPGKQKN